MTSELEELLDIKHLVYRSSLGRIFCPAFKFLKISWNFAGFIPNA